jgi:hypothetical protein
MYKKCIGSGLLLLASGSLSAQTILATEGSQLPEKKLEVALHLASPSLKSETVLRDVTADGFIKMYGDGFIPVNVTGKRFLTNKEGDILIDPRSAHMVKNGKIEPVINVLMGMDFSSNSGWISHKLEDGVKKTGDLFVVTDPTCGYCQMVEKEVDRYLQSGVVVHYVPFPRAGVEDLSQEGYAKWGAAACAKDPAKAYKDISLGKTEGYPVPTDPSLSCLDIVKSGYEYGKKVGISGTPFLYAVGVNGATFSQAGYVPADQVGPNIGVFIKQDAADKVFAQ